MDGRTSLRPSPKRVISYNTKTKMWAFANTDAGASQCGSRIYVKLITPDPWLVDAFIKVFKGAKIRPRLDKETSWHAWIRLPLEYRWLLNRAPSVEETNIWSLTAVLINTEVSIEVTQYKGKAKVRIRIYSTNYDLLKTVQEGLQQNSVRSKIILKAPRGQETPYGRRSRNYYRLTIGAKECVKKVLEETLDEIFIPYKAILAKLALQICRETMKWIDVKDIVMEARRIRRITIELSKRIIMRRAAESPPRLI